MKIVEIIVSSGRVIPHPHREYANLRPAISLKATLDETESVDMAFMALVGQAEKMLDDHVALIHKGLREEREQERKAHEQRDVENHERWARETKSMVGIDADDVDDLELDEDEDQGD